MPTEGIEAVFLATHNWGKAAKFEVSADQEPGVQIVLTVADEDAFRPGPGVEVVTPFEDTHYGTREMTVRDPDGRIWSLQAPAKK
jgi:uncharacterized glyoxalase superfamily protein PhnB